MSIDGGDEEAERLSGETSKRFVFKSFEVGESHRQKLVPLLAFIKLSMFLHVGGLAEDQ